MSTRPIVLMTEFAVLLSGCFAKDANRGSAGSANSAIVGVTTGARPLTGAITVGIPRRFFRDLAAAGYRKT